MKQTEILYLTHNSAKFSNLELRQNLASLVASAPYGPSIKQALEHINASLYPHNNNQSSHPWTSVILDSQIPVGVMLARQVLDEAEIDFIAISAHHQRLGHGRELVAHFLNSMRERGIKTVFLEVAQSNLAAIALYRNVGFLDVSVRLRYYRNGEDAIIMEKHLCE